MPHKMVKRRLRPGYLYRITAVSDTVMPDVVNKVCRIIAQFPDSHLPGTMLSASVIMQDGSFTGAQMHIQGNFKLLNPNPQTTCYCKAYAWPHRLGSGHCWGTTIAIPGHTGFCGACGRPCRITSMGLEKVSDCCATQVYNDPELEEPYAS